MKRFFILGALPVFAALVTGCSTSTPPQTASNVTPKPEQPVSAPKVTSKPAPAQVVMVTPQSLKAEIARNKGRVVVVNFWATWCAPCVKELPALAQFGSTTNGAVLLIVSADDPGNKAKVAQVADSKGHKVTRLISTDIDKFFASFDPKNKDAVALPLTYIYDRKGALVKTVSDENTLAGYQKLIKPYL